MVRFELRDPAAQRAFTQLGCPASADPFRGWCGVTACDMVLDAIPRHLTMLVGADPGWVESRLSGTRFDSSQRTFLVLNDGDTSVLRVISFPLQEGYTLRTWSEHQHFNAEALLVSPSVHRVSDPLSMMNSIDRRELIPLHAPGEIFREHPLAMVRALLLAARHKFFIDRELQEAIAEHARLIAAHGVNQRTLRRTLEDIVSARWAAAGLSLLAKLGLLEHIVPDEAALRHLAPLLGGNYHDLARRIQSERNVKTRFAQLIAGTSRETAMEILRGVFGLSENYSRSILALAGIR